LLARGVQPSEIIKMTLLEMEFWLERVKDISDAENEK
jgi:hypothetical protein